MSIQQILLRNHSTQLSISLTQVTTRLMSYWQKARKCLKLLREKLGIRNLMDLRKITIMSKQNLILQAKRNSLVYAKFCHKTTIFLENSQLIIQAHLHRFLLEKRKTTRLHLIRCKASKKKFNTQKVYFQWMYLTFYSMSHHPLSTTAKKKKKSLMLLQKVINLRSYQTTLKPTHNP